MSVWVTNWVRKKQGVNPATMPLRPGRHDVSWRRGRGLSETASLSSGLQTCEEINFCCSLHLAGTSHGSRRGPRPTASSMDLPHDG